MIREGISLDFQDVLIIPQMSSVKSRSEVLVEREFTFAHSPIKWTGVPIIAANMDTTGTFEMAEAFYQEKMLVAVHKHYTLEDWEVFAEKHKEDQGIYNHIMASTGISLSDFEKLNNILSLIPEIPFICIDIANGYSKPLAEFVKKVRATYPEKIIIAGNVVTGSMVDTLTIAGADIVKVGIGPGSVCTTRLMTGVGRPQLTAIMDCAHSAHAISSHIIGDGGCKTPSDIAKAFCGGADFVMLGGVIAGHDQSAGEITTQIINGEKVKTKSFYGMSSENAMDKHSGGVAKYRASEGKKVDVPYRGDVLGTMDSILGGIRSTCAYIGAKTIEDMPSRTEFERTHVQLNEVYGKADWYPNKV